VARTLIHAVPSPFAQKPVSVLRFCLSTVRVTSHPFPPSRGPVAAQHLNLGISGGEPRQEINPWVQSRGYRDAVTFASTIEGHDPQ